MGCRFLWKFFANKKHQPSIRYPRHLPKALQECRLRHAPTNTNNKGKSRRKAEKLADEKISEFEVRVNNGQRIRKQHFIGIKKQLSKAFRWDNDDRISLIDYLRDHQWTVKLSPYEADVHIAEDCTPGDIVISGDSDLIVHPTVTTVWRPISGGRFLEYIVDEVLAALGVSRSQLVVLGVVSHNDYNKNIYGLGCATNFKIIKDLPKAEGDIAKLVGAYLTDSRVVIKNTSNLDFANSIRVFVQRLQEGAKALPVPVAHSGNKLRMRFEEVKEKYEERKSSEVAARLAKKSTLVDHPRRHKRSQRYNRYRTIDQPPPTDNSNRTNKITHAPPAAMTLYKWKAWKSSPETPDDTLTTPDAKVKELKPRKYVPPKNKLELLRSLSKEHPFVSLDVGTLRANVRLALKAKPTLNDGAGLPDKTAPTIGGGTLVEWARLSVRIWRQGPFTFYSGAPTASSSKVSTASRVGYIVMEFISRLKQLKILERRDQPLMMDGPEFTPSSLVRSVATQLGAELKKMYHHGTYELQEQLKAQWDRYQKAKQDVSGSEEAPKADQKAKIGKQSTTPGEDTAAQDLEAAAFDEESDLKMKANKGVDSSKGADSSNKMATTGPDLEVHKDQSAIENL
ncbi:MAG: hypothetical protein JOS17DRAFT_789217 [Linnemannia elongata]|nr:MAG: hypothetical protein JOS17DRAFT_789217 [Linnemannia elongata]